MCGMCFDSLGEAVIGTWMQGVCVEYVGTMHWSTECFQEGSPLVLPTGGVVYWAQSLG